MNSLEISVALAVGVGASLIAGAIGWFFRRQLLASISSLDMSTGAILAWLMAFIMLGVIIVFPLMGFEIPGALTGIFAFMIGMLLVSTVSSKRNK